MLPFGGLLGFLLGLFKELQPLLGLSDSGRLHEGYLLKSASTHQVIQFPRLVVGLLREISMFLEHLSVPLRDELLFAEFLEVFLAQLEDVR